MSSFLPAYEANQVASVIRDDDQLISSHNGEAFAPGDESLNTQIDTAKSLPGKLWNGQPVLIGDPRSFLPNPENCRRTPASSKEDERLKLSIKRWGIINPVVIDKKNRVIIAGHRRTKLVIELGLTEVPYVEVEPSDSRGIDYASNEHVGLKPWDRGIEYLRRIKAGEGRSDIVETDGVTKGWVSVCIQLAELKESDDLDLQGLFLLLKNGELSTKQCYSTVVRLKKEKEKKTFAEATGKIKACKSDVESSYHEPQSQAPEDSQSGSSSPQKSHVIQNDFGGVLDLPVSIIPNLKHDDTTSSDDRKFVDTDTLESVKINKPPFLNDAVCDQSITLKFTEDIVESNAISYSNEEHSENGAGKSLTVLVHDELSFKVKNAVSESQKQIAGDWNIGFYRDVNSECNTTLTYEIAVRTLDWLTTILKRKIPKDR